MTTHQPAAHLHPHADTDGNSKDVTA
jgi:hypothetical protein